MNIYTIEVCACGTIWERDVNCPPRWRGSGCYDEEYEVHREFRFSVSATSLERALELLSRWWGDHAPDWCSLDCVLYNPETIDEEDDPDDGTVEEVFACDSETTEPLYDDDEPFPSCYSVELK